MIWINREGNHTRSPSHSLRDNPLEQRLQSQHIEIGKRAVRIGLETGVAQIASTDEPRGFPTPDGFIAGIEASTGFIVASRETSP